MMRKFRLLDKTAKSLWLFVSGLFFLFIPIYVIVYRVLNYTHGIFIYPFDDTFIHLNIADNLLKGNWGINDNEFASASSSVLYTLILAFFRIFSDSPLVPFVVNCFAAIMALAALHFWLTKHLVSYVGQGAIFLLVIFFTPLPLMIISGMEHTLQCLFSFLFIFYFSDWLEKCNKTGEKNLPLKILFFAVLTSTIRYEGLFLISIACVLLLTYRKFLAATILLAVCLTPLLLFGIISLAKGNFFFPNSVLVKSGSFNYSDPVKFVYDVIFEKLTYARNGMASLATQRLLIIIPLLYLVFKKNLRSSYSFILIFLFSAAIMQLSFASTGYLYRYEAYLFFCFITILSVLCYKYAKPALKFLDSSISKLAAFGVVFFLFIPVTIRCITALNKTSQACINIYDQQYQIARFTNRYYNQNVIALNDIGAVSYFTKSKIIDLWGLATIEVTKSKKQHYWTPDFLDSFCRANRVQMAIIYDSWFTKELTNRWNKAATWQIQKNVICGDSVVSFYSLDASKKDLLQQSLRSFQLELPSSVVAKYY